MKVVQAMAYGLPVVATSVGAEGISERTGSELIPLVANTPAAFARQVCELLSRPRWASDIGQQGFRWVRTFYNFSNTVDLNCEDAERLSRQAKIVDNESPR